MGSIILIVVLTVGLALWIAAPLSAVSNPGEPSQRVDEDQLDRQHRSEVLLKDVELDFAMGKMSLEDYEKLKGEFSKH